MHRRDGYVIYAGVVIVTRSWNHHEVMRSTPLLQSLLDVANILFPAARSCPDLPLRQGSRLVGDTTEVKSMHSGNNVRCDVDSLSVFQRRKWDAEA